MGKIYLLLVFLLLLSNLVLATSIMDELDTELTSEEQKDLAQALSPLGKLIAALQYVAGAVIVLALIAAGFVYFKGDRESKSKVLTIIGGVIVASILIFGATTIARALGLF